MNEDRIVYFGDSLTENGTVFSITSKVLAVPFPLESAGYAGVFSNGPVYSQILPDLLGFDQVENFAVGGAQALGFRKISDLGGAALASLVLPGPRQDLLDFRIDFPAQIARFLWEEAFDPYNGSTTASILIGLNDLAAFRPSGLFDPVVEGSVLVTSIVAATLGATTTLSLAGVDEIVLYSYPSATFFAFSETIDPALLPLADQLFAAHAEALASGAGLLQEAGISTKVVPLAEISDEIAADPETFGFLDSGPILFGSATDPLPAPGGGLFFPMNEEVSDLDPDQVVFFDYLHPTTALHGVWAAFSAAVLTESTQYLDDGGGTARGTTGDDFVLAKAGEDTLFLRRGDDTAFGGLDDDRISGQAGNDILAGGDGNDRLFGQRGLDILAGNAGDDLLAGGPGTDVIIDGLGSDKALGREGDDIFFYTDAALIGGVTGSDRDLFRGDEGEDTLYLVVSDDSRDGVEAAIANGPDASGRLVIETLNLTLVEIENIVLLDDRSEFANVAVPDELQALLEEADLWGLL